ncbi:spermidine/putrescine ABC transporter ATP-binding protein PotA [Thiothrix subterranea]|uniref:spermidine/putrescine ABC transporter ATP-binding protein PotA n=1 Tax=Thiothrix subterranea TaxID=2735563 RepID=UPI00192AB3C3|nr:spermidine/putrescine ABC transporter ATP-binding protein PotA [Thiothrix subterranea]QQZ30361.1 spermidine/putrescine ABC transporter ATP-binding protein PotA [Thiothrix subterranea]
MNRPPILTLSNVSKRFAAQEVLSEFNLTIHDGEFFTILGPSGCGKTTVLRLIAGFEQPNEGQILLNDDDIAGMPAEKRPVNTVFQSYALFPHLSVFDNVAFGLKMANVDPQDTAVRVADALAIVRLSDFATRKPHQLSGGQKQRVAIARAVVNRPKILLLDESLSALDYKLRQQMQLELKQLQRQLGITFVYVTHDQEEALSMSDRILVMHNGQAQQVGTPREIYEAPRNLFVAQFIGEINVFDGAITHALGEYQYQAMINGVEREIRCDHRFAVGDKVHVMLRPEDLRIDCRPDVKERKGFPGVVLERNYTGQTLNSHIRLENGQTVMAHEFFDEDDPDFDYSINQKVGVDWVPGWEHVIPAERAGKS